MKNWISYVILRMCNKGWLNWMPDKLYLKMRYRCVTGQKLNLKEPQTFNEKIQWLKLYDRNIEYHKMTDKYMVKRIVAETIGEKYVIPTLGIWKSFDDIDFEKLPSQFVLKCTHDSGSVVIVKNKQNIKKDKIREKMEKALKCNYYLPGREWAYKTVEPRIIAETYIEDEFEKGGLMDYKIFCFRGVPKIIQVDYNRFEEHKRNLYNTKWEFIDAEIEYPSDKEREIKKPKNLDEMLEISKKLSQNLKHVRVDLYSIKNRIYFGELTFYHGCGTESFRPESLGYRMGEWIDLK